MVENNRIREVSVLTESEIVYSFCSLVTDLAEYRAMVDAFRAKGFTSVDCEFLYVDNSETNRLDAFVAYNRFLQLARGRYIVLCHQDILPLQDGRERLDFLLDELSAKDANWALCGNAGGQTNGEYVVRITHGNAHNMTVGGPCPARVMSLDENFIVARRDANLALSHDLSGFHWYGSDLCIIADILGWHAYVIDFHIYHRSTGNMKEDYRAKATAFREKYAYAFRSRWQYVPTRYNLYISSSPIRTFVTRGFAKVRRTLL